MCFHQGSLQSWIMFLDLCLSSCHWLVLSLPGKAPARLFQETKIHYTHPYWFSLSFACYWNAPPPHPRPLLKKQHCNYWKLALPAACLQDQRVLLMFLGGGGKTGQRSTFFSAVLQEWAGWLLHSKWLLGVWLSHLSSDKHNNLVWWLPMFVGFKLFSQ